MVHKYGAYWSAHLNEALWAYRTTPRTTIRFSLFTLVYGTEAIMPIELNIPIAKTILTYENPLTFSLLTQLKAIDEKWVDA